MASIEDHTYYEWERITGTDELGFRHATEKALHNRAWSAFDILDNARMLLERRTKLPANPVARKELEDKFAAALEAVKEILPLVKFDKFPDKVHRD
jgi:hypothetical protein